MFRQLATLFFLAPLISVGQVSDSISNSDLIDPVMITGNTDVKKMSQSPYNVQVISGKTIRRMGAQNLAEVLQNQSGILIGQDAQLGTGITMQGLGGQAVKILIDGIPMIGRLNGNIDLGQIMVGQIERIEIVEGPMGVVYGSDAIAGVINIITKQLQTKTQSNMVAYADATNHFNIESYAQYPLSVGNKSYQIPLSFSIGRHYFGGVDFDTSNRSFDWKPKTKVFANADILIKKGKSQHQLSGSMLHEMMLDRSDAEYNLVSVYGYNNRFYTQRNNLALHSNFLLGKTAKVQWTNGINRYYRFNVLKRRNLVLGEEIESLIGEIDTTLNLAYNSRALVSWKPSEKIQFLYGFDANTETLSSKRVKKDNAMNDVGIFVESEWKIAQKLSIRPSLRIMYNSLFGLNPFPGILGPACKIAPLIPSFQARWTLSKHITMRGSYGKGFRSPTLKERNFLFVDINHNVQGNPELVPEISQNAILSFDYRHGISVFQAVSLTVKGFYNQLTNQIQLSLVDNSTRLFKYINIGQLNSKGIGAEFNYHQGSFNVKAGFDCISNESRLNDTTQTINFNTVQGKLNLAYTFEKPQISAQIFTRFSGETQVFYANGGAPFNTEAYTLLDFSISKQITGKKNPEKIHNISLNQPMTLQLGCKNILGITQMTTPNRGLGFPGNGLPSMGVIHAGGGALQITPGRSFFVSLTLNIQ